jgi:methylaspartate ammonia-lyase
MKAVLLDALEARYEAQISEADATLKIYLEHPVGIGEHPQHLDEIDKLFQKIADAQEKLKVIEDFRGERSAL